VLQAADPEAGPVRLDGEAGEAAVARPLGIRHREDRDEVGHGPVADEALAAGDDVLLAVTGRPGADPRSVRPGFGLGDGEGDERPAGGEVRDPTRLLLLGAGQEDRQGSQALDGEDEAGGRAGAADLLDGEAGRQEVAPEAAEPLREVGGEDVLGREQLLDVPWELRRPVDLRRPGGDPLVGHLADRVAKRALLVGEARHG